eukprot:6328399-Prymnesium_polylepis.1
MLQACRLNHEIDPLILPAVGRPRAHDVLQPFERRQLQNRVVQARPCRVSGASSIQRALRSQVGEGAPLTVRQAKHGCLLAREVGEHLKPKVVSEARESHGGKLREPVVGGGEAGRRG